MRELNSHEMTAVSGGNLDSGDYYTHSLGVAVGFLTIGVGLAFAPIAVPAAITGAVLGGSIAASGMAGWIGWSTEELTSTKAN